MKITLALIEKMISLKNGEKLPSSALRGEWVEEFLREGVLVSCSHGSKRTIQASSPSIFVGSLAILDERLADLERMRELLFKRDSRAQQASETGNSKIVQVRSCPGFLVNSYESIMCMLNGQPFEVFPQNGSMIFVSDWETFRIPTDVIVVGIENMENFRFIRQQRNFFCNEISSSKHLLFVSRYPQSTDLRKWLTEIPNRYVHFGDFDLAGINIFMTEFHQYLNNRSSFLIPSKIEEYLRNGSSERYNSQYLRFKHLSSSIPELQQLIDTINKHHKAFDQEGFIEC